MQDRFTFTSRGKRISLVYETKAQTLVVTAPSDIIKEVIDVLPEELLLDQKKEKVREQKEPVKSQADQTKKAREQKEPVKPQADQPKKAREQKEPVMSQADQPKKVREQKEPVKPQADQPKKVREQKEPVKPQADQPKKVREQKEPVKSQSDQFQKAREQKEPVKPQADQSKKAREQKEPVKSQEQKQAEPRKKSESKEQKKSKSGVFTVDKIDAERCKELLKKIKANKAMRYKTSVDDVDGSKTYSVTSQGNRAVIRYVGGSMQLSGSPSELYSELQLMLSSLSDYKTAIDTHIKYVGEEKRSSAVERQLKRKLPAAFEFLSEQSKIDLAIGIIDINNSAVVLSDYSSLLIPCFRGLERLIFDLQRAQNISVKMIGQAYEKEEGEYVLKAGYRRKIPSVVYAEVMASLYGEYVKHRNFYAHSDNSGNVSRVISDKAVVQDIFNHIMDVINYNGKKLREIGFRI